MTQKNLFDTGVTTDVTPKPRKKLVRRGPSPLALEQRFMFDGAAVGDAVQLLSDRPVEAVRIAADPIVLAARPALDTAAAAKADAEKTISTFMARPDARSQLLSLFNGGQQGAPSAQRQQAMDELLASWAAGSFQVRVELRPSTDMQGALGGFAAQGPDGQPVIYLDADWVKTAPSARAVELVLIEELGHAIDQRLNGANDTPGDEGQAFAGLLAYGDANLATTSAIDDHIQINIGGQAIAAEAALSSAIAQVHFVPLREQDVQTSLKAINTSVTGNIQTVIAITSTSNGTAVVYDQWEDGYEADLNNPLQASTKVWTYNGNQWFVDTNGDGTQNNGEAAVSGTGIAVSGNSIILNNAVNPALPLTVDFDGRDKIGSTKAVSVTRAGWSATPGTVLAGAINVIDAGNAGKVYTLPVGQNVETVATGTNKLFEYTSAHIIATQNGTVVTVDKNGNGVADVGDLSFTLNEGETYFVNGGLNAGAKITATKGIGVYLIAGDVASAYENRWFALTPDEQWASSYFAPVGTTLAADPAYVLLYNPNASAITVKWDTQTGAGTPITVAANSTAYALMPASAAHFYTEASGVTAAPKFFAVSVIDADATSNATHDWSYSLVPETYLTTKLVVAWGPGNTNANPTTALNGSPLWVTTTANTDIYIDSTTVTVKDASGAVITGTTVGTSTKYTVKKLQSYRVFDADNDQTGLAVYTKDGTLITAAWGEDPSIAGAGTPYLDMGTTITPFPDYVLSKTSAETSTAVQVGASDNDGSIELGEQITYTVRLTNRAVIDLYDIVLKDTVAPADSATYIADSTVLTVYNPEGTKAWMIEGTTQTFYNANGTVASTVTNSSLAGSNFPLSSTGYRITDLDPNTGAVDGLKRGGVVEVSYRVLVRSNINKALADSDYVITNSVTMSGTGVTRDKVNDTKITTTTTDGEVYLMDSAFASQASNYNPGTTIGLRVVDGDQNRNAALAETLTVTVTNTTTGELEAKTLTETGVNTGIYQGTLVTTNADVGTNNSATLNLRSGNGLKVEYTDALSGGTGPTDATGVDNPINWGTTKTTLTSGTNTNRKTATVSAAPPPTPTDGKLEFLDNAFASTGVNFAEGSTLGIRVTDADQNTTGAADTLTVTVTNTSTGEAETVTLTETTTTSGIFQGTLATSTASADAANNSGRLQMVLGNAIKVEYTDPITGGSTDNPTTPGTNANRDTATVVKTKILYLSAATDLDRVDPVATTDATTSTSSAVTPGSAVNVSRTDPFANGPTSANAYSGGTNWSAPWTESDTTQDADSDNVRVREYNNGTNAGDYAIRLNGGGTRFIQREFAALTSTAVLAFDYQLRGVDSADVGLTISYSSNGTNWSDAATIKGFRATGLNETGLTAYPNNSTATTSGSTVQNGVVNVLSGSLPVGARFIRFTLETSSTSDDVYIDNVGISTNSAAAATPVTFTQAIPMATDITLPASGVVNISTHISAETGLGNGSYAGITAALTYTPSGGGTAVTIATLGSATYAEVGTTGVGTLSWSGDVGASNLTVPKGANVKLVITNTVASSSFKIDYDSTSKPSRIELPVANVIDIVDVDGVDLNSDGDITDSGEGTGAVAGVQEIGFYDQPAANGGNQITAGSISAGGMVYIRVKVKDPFGDYDITGLKLSIDGPGGSADIGVGTPVSASVVNAGTDGSTYKTFEYAWQTANITGDYAVTVTAAEGDEGTVTDVATGSFIVTALDLGTPSVTQFITALGGADAGSTYVAGANAFLRVTDLDENSNSASRQTVSALVNGTAVTLTETGNDTGIFELDLPVTFRNLTAGTVLTASYTDATDAVDVSGDTVSVPAAGNLAPTLDLDTTVTATVNNTGRFTEGDAGLAFALDSSGATIADDATAVAFVRVSIATAQIADGASDRVLVNGATSGGTIALNFANAASISNVGLGGVTWQVAATVTGGTSTLQFSKSGGGNVTLAQAEALVEALRYHNASQNPTETNRVFTVLVNDGASTALNSNAATFTVNVVAVANPPVLDLDANDSSGATGADFKTLLVAGASAVAIADSDVTLTDVDSANLESVRIVLSSPADGAAETLSVSGSLPTGITASTYDAATGVLTLTGTASVANYRTAIGQIRYANSSAAPTLGDRRIEVSANDGSASSNLALATVRVIDVKVSAATPVNEASTYAMFTVVATAGEALTLATGSTAVTNDTDATTAGFTATQYSTDGTTWTTYSWNGATGNRPTVAGTGGVSGTVYVRVNVTSEADGVYEGPETFTLTASTATGGGRSATAVATIVDDGTGSKYAGEISSGSPTAVVTGLDNDTPTVSVSNVTVSEASPYAVFTVSLSNASTQAISFTPSLVSGSATVGTDTGASAALEYFNGTAWVAANTGVTLAAGSTSVLVRTAITNDTTYEGSETFTLSTGAITGAVSNAGAASGTGTIKDDGSSSNVFNADTNTATPAVGTPNNDTPTVSVSSPTVVEGAQAVFTVSLDKTSTTAVSFTPVLSSGTATLGTDTAAASTLEVSTDGGSNWSTVSGAVSIAAGQSSVQLRLATTDDAIAEASETFTLTTGALTGTLTSNTAVVGTATITDNDVGDATAPVVTASQSFNYAENQTANAVVATVLATDAVGVTGFRFENAGGTAGATTTDTFFTIAADGKISITAAGVAAGVAQNDFETSPNSFTYGVQARDAAGNWSTSTGITLNVNAVNEAPAGTDKTITTLEDTAYTLTVTDFGFSDAKDTPANTLLAVKLTQLPSSGSLTLNGVAVTADQSVTVADITDNKLVFTPALNANGVANANFRFAVQDNGGTANGGVDLDASPNTITFNVTAVNDAAVIAGDAIGAVTEDLNVTTNNLNDTGTLSISDADTDEASFQTTGITASAGALGTLNITSAGVWSYTVPNADVQYLKAGETKTETFTVKALDGTTKDVVVTITGVNDAPTAVDDSLTVASSGTVAANIIAPNDSDSNGDPLTIASVTATPFADLKASTDATYTAADGFKELKLTHGTLFIKQDGSTQYRHDGRAFLVTPLQSTGTLEYQLADGQWQTLAQPRVVTFTEIQLGRLRYAPGTGELGEAGVQVASVLEIDTTRESFAYGVSDGALVSNQATVAYTITDPLNLNNTSIVPSSDTDVDGIQTNVEAVLASRALGIEGLKDRTYVLNLANLVGVPNSNEALLRVDDKLDGDLNLDGIRDGEQNAVTTYAWINNLNFEQANANPASLPTIKSIVNLVAETSTTSFQIASPLIQLKDVRILALTPQQDAALAALVDFTPSWTPMGFSAEIKAGVTGINNIDVDPNREGNQWRFTVDISRTGETVDTFVAFYKWIDQDVITAYQTAGLPLQDLSGNAITQVGWYDFTRKTAGGDGVAISLAGDAVLRLDYIITDNSFGDSSTTVGKLTDPGIPVFINYLNDSRPLTISSPVVNETSPFAYFTLQGAANQIVTLATESGTATRDGVDFGNTGPTQLTYSTDGGLTWTPSTGPITLPTDGKLLVRTPLVEDNIADNNETFTLNATTTGGAVFKGTATIKDDGAGTVFLPDGSADPAGKPTDDRPLSVNEISLSESSPFAVFTVTGQPGQQLSLALASGTATVGVDSATALQYFDGSAWQSYVPGSLVSVPAGGTTLLVRVAVVNDALLEGAETFSLRVTNTGGSTASGTATLLDDGSSAQVFDADNNTGVPTPATADDDRPKPVVPEAVAPVVVPPKADPTPAVLPATVVTTPVPTFDSALKTSAPTTLPAAPPAPIGEVLTSSSGFQVAVVEAATPNLAVFRGIADQFVDGNKPGSFALPADAFVHTKAEASVALVAKMSDGQDMPSWIQFDARSGTFQVNPPTGYTGDMQIKVIATDNEGREASSIFRFTVGEDKKPVGRNSLSEQINLAAMRTTPWLELMRQQQAKRVAAERLAERLAERQSERQTERLVPSKAPMATPQPAVEQEQA